VSLENRFAARTKQNFFFHWSFWLFTRHNVVFAWTHFLLFVVNYPTARWIFPALLEIRFPIANNCPRWRRIFEGISQDGVWTKISENLCASQKMKAFQFIPFSWKDDQITNIYGMFRVAVLHKDDQITDNSGIFRMAVTPECIKTTKWLTAMAGHFRTGWTLPA